jgi:mannose-1-phosphate guanylyltransferase/mannose-6-phosphate isomerase
LPSPARTGSHPPGQPLADAVILAGGAGTRLWPLSRSATPKHLLKLLGDRSLLRATYERAALVANRVLVVTEASQIEAARAELPELGDGDWIVEPGRRGTAACLALAARVLPPGEVMISLHADHLIPDSDAFARTVGTAVAWAADSGSLVTVGLTPRSAATGFGYIRRGEPVSVEGRGDAYRSSGFVEKPATAEAEAMVQSGDYLWNTGIFAWRNQVFLDELAKTAPEVAVGADAAALALAEGRLGDYQRTYMSVPEMAVDHAVMERTNDLLVVEADFDWSDGGSWADLRDVLPLDADGNAVEGEALILDGAGNVVHSDGRLVALVGVSDLVVVSTEDAILVCPRDRVQDVKLLVAELKRRGRDDLV